MKNGNYINTGLWFSVREINKAVLNFKLEDRYILLEKWKICNTKDIKKIIAIAIITLLGTIMKKNFPEINKEEEYWFSLKEIAEYNLSSIPEKLTILIDRDYEGNYEFPLTQIKNINGILKLHISTMLYPEDYWKQKYTALTFAESIVKGLKLLNDSQLNIENPHFEDNGADDGVYVAWELTLPIDSTILQIEKSSRKSLELAFNNGISHLEGLSSILILGKDTEPHLKKLKDISEITETLGYNSIIIKEKEDILGETVKQKVLRYGMNSKFLIIENTETSGHLYELPHFEITQKIIVVLQEEDKGSTWMFEELYFTLRTVKRFRYKDEESFKNSIKDGIKWAEDTFSKLCEYQMQEVPWLKK